MPKQSILTKKILEHLSSEERKHLNKLEKIHQTMGEKMVKAQREYVQYTRKTKDDDSLKARKLLDKGFLYEGKAFQAREDLVKYRELLNKKYSTKK